MTTPIQPLSSTERRHKSGRFVALTLFILSFSSEQDLLAQQLPATTPRGIPGGVSDLGPSNQDDPAFFSKYYERTSPKRLEPGEFAVTYDYGVDPENKSRLQYNSPCGTLMTQFDGRGSVRVGRGPVYRRALQVCQAQDPLFVPNDFSFRTYGCENVPDSGVIVGRATFGFFCGLPNDSVKCSQDRISTHSASEDWNCGGINWSARPNARSFKRNIPAYLPN